MPQLILQSLLIFKVLSPCDLQTADECNTESNDDTFVINSNLTLITISIISTSFNLLFQLIRLVLESKAVEERLDRYALNMIMGRVDWIPYKSKFSVLGKNINQLHTESINYNITFDLACITWITGMMYGLFLLFVCCILRVVNVLHVGEWSSDNICFLFEN